MIYYLGQILSDYDISGARLLQYISFRAVLAFVLALLLTTITGGHLIRRLQKAQIGETIRDLGLEGQMKKKGTPTMGGIIIFIAIVVPTLLLARLDNVYVWLMLGTTFLLGAIGFVDDYIKVFKGRKAGLKGTYKIIGQVATGCLLGLVLYLSPAATIRPNSEVRNNGQIEDVCYAEQDIKSTQTTIPFVKNNNFDYAYLVPDSAHRQNRGWVVFILACIFLVMAMSNCVNLTDGIDGLAAGSAAPVGIVLMIMAYVSSHIQMAEYLNIMFIPGSEELVIYSAAFVGATLGFLWYNAYPAQVFMGDTGSLMIGGVIAALAILVRKEMLLPIMGALFIIEGFSSVLQVAYFKITKHKYGEGRRIFKMTPLHHHFQKDVDPSMKVLLTRPRFGIPESKITVRFWLFAVILAALSIATLKMR